MKAPSIEDRAVKVLAYLTDQTFGYDHWRAAQFSAPSAEVMRPAVLLICQSDEERDALFASFAQERPCNPESIGKSKAIPE